MYIAETSELLILHIYVIDISQKFRIFLSFYSISFSVPLFYVNVVWIVIFSQVHLLVTMNPLYRRLRLSLTVLCKRVALQAAIMYSSKFLTYVGPSIKLRICSFCQLLCKLVWRTLQVLSRQLPLFVKLWLPFRIYCWAKIESIVQEQVQFLDNSCPSVAIVSQQWGLGIY
jgi:hypothetical protein